MNIKVQLDIGGQRTIYTVNRRDCQTLCAIEPERIQGMSAPDSVRPILIDLQPCVEARHEHRDPQCPDPDVEALLLTWMRLFLDGYLSYQAHSWQAMPEIELPEMHLMFWREL